MITKFNNIASEQFKKFLGVAVIVLADFVTNSTVHAQSNLISLNDNQEASQEVNFNGIKFNDLRFIEMSYTKRKQIRTQIEDKLKEKLSDYQRLGLYDQVDGAKFRVTINSYQRDNANYIDKTISLNIGLKSSVNDLFLTNQEFRVNGESEEFNLRYNFEKTFTHELGHLQFTNNSKLSNNDKLNEAMLSDIKLGIGERAINTSYQYLQENFADVYGELAYLNKNNFSEKSINTLQDDIDTRIQDQVKLQKEHADYGSNFDSHDTANSLSILKALLKDPIVKEKISRMEVSKYDILAKAIVLNSYIDYVQSEEIKKNIEFNMRLEKNESVLEQYKIISELNLPKKDLINLVNAIDSENQKTHVITKIARLREKINKKNASQLKLN